MSKLSIFFNNMLFINLNHKIVEAHFRINILSMYLKCFEFVRNNFSKT
jgi:hypothetical protein